MLLQRQEPDVAKYQRLSIISIPELDKCVPRATGTLVESWICHGGRMLFGSNGVAKQPFI